MLRSIAPRDKTTVCKVTVAAPEGLDDLVKKRPSPGKIAYKERVRRILESPKAQTVASNMYYGLRKTARALKTRGGKASTKG